jgi:hypothetical protein
MSYLCRNGHLVRHGFQAGLDCAKCKSNARRREAAAAAKKAEIALKPTNKSVGL